MKLSQSYSSKFSTPRWLAMLACGVKRALRVLNLRYSNSDLERAVELLLAKPATGCGRGGGKELKRALHFPLAAIKPKPNQNGLDKPLHLTRPPNLTRSSYPRRMVSHSLSSLPASMLTHDHSHIGCSKRRGRKCKVRLISIYILS